MQHLLDAERPEFAHELGQRPRGPRERAHLLAALALAQSTPAQDGRAGLGLLTVARHASTPLTYEFLPHESELTFFSLFAEV